MSVSVPQRAAGISAPETRGESRGELAPQPVVFERANGERLHFVSVASFRLWWDAEQGDRRRNR